eukprot:583899-Pleurochrysis_carterae.AAC.3
MRVQDQSLRRSKLPCTWLATGCVWLSGGKMPAEGGAQKPGEAFALDVFLLRTALMRRQCSPAQKGSRMHVRAPAHIHIRICALYKSTRGVHDLSTSTGTRARVNDACLLRPVSATSVHDMSVRAACVGCAAFAR